MKRVLAGAAFMLLALGGSAFAQQRGYVTTDVNLRAGPSTAYPVVVVLEGGTPLGIFGCLDDYSWCDVDWRGSRGWIAARYLAYDDDGRRVEFVPYAPTIGVPIVAFSFGDYWGRYYRGRSWYTTYDRWGPPPNYYRPPPPGPGYRPPPPPPGPGYRPPPPPPGGWGGPGYGGPGYGGPGYGGPGYGGPGYGGPGYGGPGYRPPQNRPPQGGPPPQNRPPQGGPPPGRPPQGGPPPGGPPPGGPPPQHGQRPPQAGPAPQRPPQSQPNKQAPGRADSVRCRTKPDIPSCQ